MDESFAPASAIDKKRLKALCTRSDAKGLRQLMGHAVALAATGGAIAAAPSFLWLVPALFAHGVLLVFLFAPLHETIHRTAFESRRLNDSLAWICGAVLMLPPAYFRAFHFAHHRYTQDPVRDPELAAGKPASFAAYLVHVSGLPFWRERITTTSLHAAGKVTEAFIPKSQRAGVVREARLLIALYAFVAGVSLATGSWAAVLYWVAPVALGQPFLRLFLLAEHTACPLVPDMLENSRTTRSNALVRWLAWNMPYHSEHHCYPALPYHALPAAHDLLAPHIAVQATGYLAVHRSIIARLSG